jgi:hypothetical protein
MPCCIPARQRADQQGDPEFMLTWILGEASLPRRTQPPGCAITAGGLRELTIAATSGLGVTCQYSKRRTRASAKKASEDQNGPGGDLRVCAASNAGEVRCRGPRGRTASAIAASGRCIVPMLEQLAPRTVPGRSPRDDARQLRGWATAQESGFPVGQKAGASSSTTPEIQPQRTCAQGAWTRPTP